MPRHLTHAALTLILTTLTTLTTFPPTTQAQPFAENEWATAPATRVLATGDMSAQPGLEAIVTDGGVARIASLVDGIPHAALPSPFDDALRSLFTIRDVDGDGRAEIIAAHWNDQTFTGTVGLIDVDTGTPTKVFTVPTARQVRATGSAQLFASGPEAIVVDAVDLLLFAGDTGQGLYDSSADPSVGSFATTDAWTVGDFDADGLEEVLVHFSGSVGSAQSALIGAVTTPTSVEGPRSGTLGTTLMQSTPNPAGGPTSIRFALTEAQDVRLRVFDAAGRAVRTLVDERRAAGRHHLVWDGRDDAGQDVGAGVYFYELQLPGTKLGRKMVVVR